MTNTGALANDTTFYFHVAVIIPATATDGTSTCVRLTVKDQNGAGTEDNWRVAGNDTRTHDTVTKLSPPAPAGTISGKVTKPDNLTAIPGMLVEAIQNNTIKKSAITDMLGAYSMNLTTGTYDIKVSSIGYRTVISTGVVVLKDTTLNLNFAIYRDIILALTAADREIILKWSMVDTKGIMYYQIYRSTIDIENYYKLIGTSTITEVKDTWLINGLTYYYRLYGIVS